LLAIGGLGVLPSHAAQQKERKEKQIDPAAVVTTKNGIKFTTVKEGACPLTDFTGKLGSCFPAPEKFVIIDYTAVLPSGQVFDTTEKKGGKPLAFRMGNRQVIPGLEEVLLYMKPGAEVVALIPATLAYGDKGVACNDTGECLVPPGSNLKFYLKLIRVTEAYM
jgi:FKBP-type peptidyl-prolyl cis-trans isomerase